MDIKRKKELWFEFYNEIIDNFSYNSFNKKMNKNEVFPTSYREVKFAEIKIKEIENLNLEDEELSNHLEELKKLCKKAIKKRFVFSPGMFITILLWVALNIFLAYSSQKNLDNYIAESDNATELVTEKVEAEASNQKLVILQKEAQKQVYLAVLWFCLFIAYIFSARMPRFLIYKRRMKREEMKAKGATGSMLSSMLSAVSSIPDNKTDSSIFTPASSGILIENPIDGSLERIHVDTGPGMQSAAGIKILLYTIILVTAFFVMIAALPLLIIFNYITNYQYKLVEKIGSFLSIKSNKKFEAQKLKERIELTEIDNKVGDEICARYSNDLYLYPAIIKETDENGATVIYTDDSTEYVKKKDICSRSFAVKNLKVQCDWESKGEYYECLIKKTNADSYQVVYKDRSKEIVTINQLRFYQ